ncbi:TLD family protein [Histomonas meleagridis]|uniref:TLD family protein n=1 Tax=Histomonas meleagridis TaxID=135588 RepID=UPI003559AF9B|nr:TLD family protein [Histomonas meleagridis]
MERNKVEYTVQNDDTLQLIALKFGVPIFSIRQINNIQDVIPGDKIIIELDSTLNNLNPIDSQIFNRPAPINGLLLLLDECIRFDPYSKSIKPITIDIKGLVASTIEPHPCELFSFPDEVISEDSLSLLTVYFLYILDDDTSLDTYVFTGKLSELTEYQKVLETRAAKLQAEINYTPPPLTKFMTPPEKSKKSIEKPAFSDGESSILDSSSSIPLRSSLPLRFKTLKWFLKYRLSRDGVSYQALSSTLKRIRSCVILIKTSTGDTIGFFSSNGVSVSSTSSYGSGDSFVFTYTPQFVCYRWARTAKYFTYYSQDELMCGSSNAAAIYLDRNLMKGFSEKCKAFNSLQLTSKVQFKVIDLEVWGIGK